MNKKIDISAIVTLIKDFDYEMLNDAEWDNLKRIDPSNKDELSRVFYEITVPAYEAMDHRSKELIKSNLHSMLSTPDFDFQKILAFVNLPFDPIKDPKQFFSILWRTLFKNDID